MTRSIVLMILVCTVLYSIETANIDKFLERDLLPRSHDTYRRNIIPPIHIMKTNKQTRTIITDNTDIPTSNTPDTPASDVDTPDTPDLSGDGISEYSGNDIDDASGYSKKSKIVHKSKNVSLKSTIKTDKSPKDVSKKQYLGVPAQREGLGGDLNAEGGLGGLGGDMGGIPTGMGAGAEPLGAFENNNEAPQQAPENEVANNQGLEEEGPPPIAAFNKGERGPESEGENSEFIHDEVGNGPGARPFDREDMGEGSPIRGGGGMNFNAPQPDMTESMTNNIGAMDKANIQGDSEVAEMVRQYAKGKDTLNNSPFEQPEVPQPNEAQLSREFGKGDDTLNGRFNADAAKRRLLKIHHKRKAHKFKKLQRH